VHTEVRVDDRLAAAQAELAEAEAYARRVDALIEVGTLILQNHWAMMQWIGLAAIEALPKDEK
jgi:hypothetical protein